MKLVTKIQFSFVAIILVVFLQSFLANNGVKSMGSEISEIAEYQIPINSIMVDLEKDILSEEVLVYELLEAYKEHNHDKVKEIKHRFDVDEKETDEKCVEIEKLLHDATANAEESHVKQEYQNISTVVENVCEEQKKFENFLTNLEHELESSDSSELANTKKHTTGMKHVIEAMDKEISNSAHSLSKLLEASTSQAEEDEHSLVTNLIIISIVTFIFIVIIAYTISAQFKKSVSNIQTSINNIAQTKDLTTLLDDSKNDEFGLISKDLNSLLAALRNLIGDSKTSSNENSAISHELSTTALNVGNNVEHSVTIVKEVTQNANKINEEIHSSIDNAKESKDEIIQANETLIQAKDEIITLTEQVEESVRIEVELADKMSSLSHDTNEVKNILEVISDIAEQTNLLALNAAIEAARAGEHGRGFAVVADEVRKLAERTQKSLTEINATISVIVQSVLDASDEMSKNSNEIQNLLEIASSAREKIDSTVEIVNSAVDASDKTAADFESTSTSVGKIVEDISKINEISSTNARNVEEIAAAADHLNNMTDKLNTQLEVFNT
jgi:methyl-accepting chemotaxis protein